MDEKGLQTEIRRANDACAVHGCQVSQRRQSRKAATSSILVKRIWLPPMLAMKYVGLKLGLSIHDHTELETAPVAEPEYVALAPVYPTASRR